MIKIVKVISDITQADVRLGINPKYVGSSYSTSPDSVPAGLLRMLKAPLPSAKHEMMISQGKTKEAMESLNSYGYLEFQKTSMAEMGILDPTYRNDKIKCCTLAFQPEFVKAKDFVMGINWLRKYIETHKNGDVFSVNTRVLIYENEIPTDLRRELTIEDVQPAPKKGDE